MVVAVMSPGISTAIDVLDVLGAASNCPEVVPHPQDVATESARFYRSESSTAASR